MSPSASSEDRLVKTIERQAREIEQLQTALRARELVDVAKGMLVERLGCTPELAFTELSRLSQETNTKLIRVAAALVAQVATSSPGDKTEFDVGELLPQLSKPQDRDRLARDSERPRARAQLAGALIRSASSGDEIARTLRDEGLGAELVALMGLDSDGGLTLLGNAALPPEEVSQWRRVPPQMDTYMTRVVKSRHAILLSAPDPDADVPVVGATAGPHGARAALPLMIDARLFGVVILVWREPRTFSRVERHHLAALADHAARALHQDGAQLGAETLLSPGSAALQTLLDTLLDPAIVLSAARENEQIVDFLVDFANEATCDAFGRFAEDLVGRRLLELYPAALAGELFEAYVEVMETGRPYSVTAMPVQATANAATSGSVAIRASRFFDGLLLSWRTLDELGRA